MKSPLSWRETLSLPAALVPAAPCDCLADLRLLTRMYRVYLMWGRLATQPHTEIRTRIHSWASCTRGTRTQKPQTKCNVRHAFSAPCTRPLLPSRSIEHTDTHSYARVFSALKTHTCVPWESVGRIYRGIFKAQGTPSHCFRSNRLPVGIAWTRWEWRNGYNTKNKFSYSNGDGFLTRINSQTLCNESSSFTGVALWARFLLK